MDGMVTGHVQRRAQAAIWAAVLAALGLLLGCGVWYRLQAGRYARYGASIALPPGALARLPMEIGDWRGRDLPLAEKVVQATDTDDRVNRVYERPASRHRVSLWVGYGLRLRDLTPHRPEVCYPGAGWTMIGSELVELKAADGSMLPCQIHRFQRGGLSLERIAVLNYYIVDGQYWPDVELLRERASRPDTDAHYVAQVQISCPDTAFRQKSKQVAREFASDSAPAILSLLTEAVAAAKAPAGAG